MPTARGLPVVAVLLAAAVTADPVGAVIGPDPGTWIPQDASGLRGRVVLGADSSGLAGQTVVLHRVTPDSGFAVDSAESAADGGFRLPLPAPRDSGTVHIVSARYRGNLYFGPVIHGDVPPDPYVVAVYDTASAATGASLLHRRRTLALMTEPTGTRVLDVMDVTSGADRTLVGPDSAAAWWRVSLPSGATGPSVLPGGVGAADVAFGRAEARIRASVPPTGRRLVLGYTLPSSGTFTLAPAHPVASLEVVHRGQGSLVPGPGLEPAEPLVDGERRFTRFVGSDLAADDTVRLELTGGAGGGGGAAAWILLALSGVLALGAWMSWRRLGSSPPETETVGGSDPT